MQCLSRLAAMCLVLTLIAGCDTLDSDYEFAPLTLPTYAAPSGDNRSHEQKLSDQAWWDEYHR